MFQSVICINIKNKSSLTSITFFQQCHRHVSSCMQLSLYGSLKGISRAVHYEILYLLRDTYKVILWSLWMNLQVYYTRSRQAHGAHNNHKQTLDASKKFPIYVFDSSWEQQINTWTHDYNAMMHCMSILRIYYAFFC